MSSKRAKFVQLAEKRVNNTLNNLRLIGNLSNSASYEYTQKDVDKIFRAITRAVNDARSRFNSAGDGSSTTFRLAESTNRGEDK